MLDNCFHSYCLAATVDSHDLRHGSLFISRSRALQEFELSCLVVVVTTELALEVLRRALLLRVVLVVLAVLEIESVQVSLKGARLIMLTCSS